MQDDAKLKVADFGLAVEVQGLQKLGIAGSPLYMAPEIILEKEYGNEIP